jgi:hypothetical protein
LVSVFHHQDLGGEPRSGSASSIAIDELVDVFVTAIDECKIQLRGKRGLQKNIETFVARCMYSRWEDGLCLGRDCAFVYLFGEKKEKLSMIKSRGLPTMSLCAPPCADDNAYKSAKQRRMNISHFEPKAVIGKGSFSTVCRRRLCSLPPAYRVGKVPSGPSLRFRASRVACGSNNSRLFSRDLFAMP